MGSKTPSNTEIAEHLDRIASLLDVKEESPFRIRSYRSVAITVREIRTPLAGAFLKKGEKALTDIKGIGEKLAGLIREFIETGQTELLTTLDKKVPLKERPPVGTSTKKKTRAPVVPHSASVRTDLPVKTILEIDKMYRTKAAANKLKKIAP